jgi:hypothetical protein
MAIYDKKKSGKGVTLNVKLHLVELPLLFKYTIFFVGVPFKSVVIMTSERKI